MPEIELFGSRSCPYTQELREWLEFRGADFAEYDVDSDSAARDRARSLSGGQFLIPILVENGRVTQIGWQGRGCALS